MCKSRLRARLLARNYDRLMRSAEQAFLGRTRATILAPLAGTILEIGGGTGANLAHYPSAITHLEILEPDPNMVAILRDRLPPHGSINQVGAESLPYADGIFDAVVSTLALCTVPDPGRALREAHRVLRPGGTLVFVEHVRSRRPRLARWQDRTENIWTYLTYGCHANRQTDSLIRATGFEVDVAGSRELPARAGLVRDFVWGTATPKV